MAALRRLLREEWERKLRSYGCYPADNLTALNTAEWWRWPWKGAPFTVPADSEGFLDQVDFQRIIADMATLAPPGWEFLDVF